MTPDEFIAKWKASSLKESAGAQEHFIDLCRLLGEQTPAEADPAGENYGFEHGATKTTGGEGFADVWKRGHFAWEYKGKRKDLNAAYAQLQQYAVALENPPLLIVSDMKTIVIHTNWTNSVRKTYPIPLDELRNAEARAWLKAAFTEPERLKPGQTRQSLTEAAASDFARIALRLRERGHDSQAVAHFVNRLVFCMFAEDIGLLPRDLFTRMLEQAVKRPDNFAPMAKDLFGAMEAGGLVGFEEVAWFNGGLFDDDTALPLEQAELNLALRVARLDWSEIDPSIFGTLFERGLDPDKRSQLGAHYTDRDKIMLIVDPVIVQPLRQEWSEAKAEIEAHTARRDAAWARIAAIREEAGELMRADEAATHAGEGARQKEITRHRGRATRAQSKATKRLEMFLDRLRAFRVLDPACGSGDFLYLALLALKDIEHRAGLDAEALGLPRRPPRVGPEAVRGIEINPYAAELARVTAWIGEIQWMRRNGFDAGRNPILKPLDNIECRDAVLNEDGTEATWPEADVIIGNPPFLGGKLMRDVLGDDYVDRLFTAYDGRVPAETDLVCYWFAKAWAGVREAEHDRVGLVATNSIRGGANRRVIDAIVEEGIIFDAWDDEPWVVDGAAVRVALIAFARKAPSPLAHLDGVPVTRVHADLTADAFDLTQAKRLGENEGIAYMGDTKGGAFDIAGELAREWLRLPANPNGRPNSDVLKPWRNGMDITRRTRDMWIVDFGWKMSEAAAAYYEAPYQHIETGVRPARSKNKREAYRLNWWRHVEPRPGMWSALADLSRFIVTPTVARHRLFAWCDLSICPDHQLIAIASDDDTTFGILHSRFHETWALRLGTSLEDRPRYTPTTTFETYPFPDGLTPDIPATDYASDPRARAIAVAAARLNELREAWLNPPDLVDRVPEVVAGYPDRLVAKDEAAAAILKKRTLTNLYNERPTWLANAHADLDAAVAATYGWSADIATDDALAALLALNLARAPDP